MIVAPLGDERHFITTKVGVFGNALAERSVRLFYVPAFQDFFGRIVGFTHIWEACVYFIRGDSLILERSLVSVPIEMNRDTLCPVGIHMEAGLTVRLCEFVGQGYFGTVFRGIVPAGENIAGPHRIFDLAEASDPVIQNVVIVLAYDAGADVIRRSVIIRVEGNGDREAFPGCVEGDGFSFFFGQILYGRFIVIRCRRSARIGAPALEGIARPGEGPFGKGTGLVIHGRDGIHLALAVTGIEGNGVLNGLPFRLIGGRRVYDGVLCQLLIATKPTDKAVACSGGFRRHTVAKRAGQGNRNSGIKAIPIFERHRAGVLPYGIQVEILIEGDGAAILVLHSRTIRCRGPSGEDLAGIGKGIGLQDSCAAEYFLLNGVLRAVIGMEGDKQRCTDGKIPYVNAIVKFVAAPVLFIFNTQFLAFFNIELQTRPGQVAAFSIDKRGIAKFDRALVVLGFGGDLILKCYMGLLGKGQGKGAGGVRFSGTP